MRNPGILALAFVVAGTALALPPPAAAHDRSHRHAAHGHVRHLHSHYHHRAAWPRWLVRHGDFRRWCRLRYPRLEAHLPWQRLYRLYRHDRHYHRRIERERRHRHRRRH